MELDRRFDEVMVNCETVRYCCVAESVGSRRRLVVFKLLYPSWIISTISPWKRISKHSTPRWQGKMTPKYRRQQLMRDKRGFVLYLVLLC